MLCACYLRDYCCRRFRPPVLPALRNASGSRGRHSRLSPNCLRAHLHSASRRLNRNGRHEIHRLRLLFYVLAHRPSQQATSTMSSSFRVHSLPPPTVNVLTTRQKTHLRRSSTKISKVLGATPQFMDADPPGRRVP
ncbi:hypothetical protein SCHPADRAFT_695846 [Schizopora paradoxa]|uniref:Uncharacterized protein n=1 Tax=Schizopora paradoxa TaxID=27342 RepID=A0A0H2R381_9AGAM|nr:hypothetical protein SCHPADRAFT_695846 [Schizopora paradoxa]